MAKEFSCYGRFSDSPECRKCEYGESCGLYTAGFGSNERDHRFSSWEKVAPHRKWNHENNVSGEQDMISALAHFFNYLLMLDDHTLGVIAGICCSWHDNRELSISKLSKEYGCSRQAMHRKVLNMIIKHPELSGLFMMLMPKLSRSRRNFMAKIRTAAVSG